MAPQPGFLRSTVASDLRAMASSKYKPSQVSKPQKQHTARRLDFHGKKEQFIANLQGLHYNYEDVPEQDD